MHFIRGSRVRRVKNTRKFPTDRRRRREESETAPNLVMPVSFQSRGLSYYVLRNRVIRAHIRAVGTDSARSRLIVRPDLRCDNIRVFISVAGKTNTSDFYDSAAAALVGEIKSLTEDSRLLPRRSEKTSPCHRIIRRRLNLAFCRFGRILIDAVAMVARRSRVTLLRVNLLFSSDA